MAFYLAIVSPLDAPLFELQFTTSKPGSSSATAALFPTWSTFTGANGADLQPVSAASAGSLSAQQANLGVGTGQAGDRHMLQMVAHAGLDAVEEVAEGSGSL
jgi:hypothetical protein